MFIDDAAANIRDVQRVCCVLHVANKGGMDATHMSALTSWAKPPAHVPGRAAQKGAGHGHTTGHVYRLSWHRSEAKLAPL